MVARTATSSHRRPHTPPRILHVTNSTDGGVASYLRGLASDQAERGWVVTIACPELGILSDALRDIRGIAVVPWQARREPGPSVATEIWTLRTVMRRVRPQLMHLHSSKAGLAGRLAALGTATTVIYQPHGWSFEATTGVVRRVSTLWERVGAQLCDDVVCVSEAERDRGVLAGIGRPMTVVVNGVAVDRTPADERDRRVARHALGLADVPTLACVGRLCEQKGQDVLLRAWPQIRSLVPSAQLVFVGSGPDEDELRAFGAPNVMFAGARDDVDTWLAASSVVVVPSRWEALSLGLLEAMAAGRTVVATDVDGVREALGDELGAVVPPEDPGALVHPIVERLLDRELAALEGKRSAERAKERFDAARTHDEMAELYVRHLDRIGYQGR